MNEQLINILKSLLGTTVSLKFKAHGYHWNVESEYFSQYHEFFGDIYEAIDGTIDPMAEWIRILDGYAPFKLSRFAELSMVPETDVTSVPLEMAKDLYDSIEIAIEGFKNAGTAATQAQEYALANFLADCQGTLQKFCWQLRASLKEVGE